MISTTQSDLAGHTSTLKGANTPTPIVERPNSTLFWLVLVSVSQTGARCLCRGVALAMGIFVRCRLLCQQQHTLLLVLEQDAALLAGVDVAGRGVRRCGDSESAAGLSGIVIFPVRESIPSP